MSAEEQRSEHLKAGIASALGRLRGDVIPLPVAFTPAQPDSPQGPAPQSIAPGIPQALRADPGMKTNATVGSRGDLGGMLGDTPSQGEEPDLLSGLEPPQLMPPLTEEERALRQRRNRNRRLLGLVSLGAIVAIASLGYWTFGASQNDEVPLITAEQSPEKIKPEDEGGLEIPNQDIAVLENADGAAPDSGVETILPAPEQPVAAEEMVPEPPEVPEPDTEIVDNSMDGIEQAPEIAAQPAQETASALDDLAIAAPEIPQVPEVAAPEPETIETAAAPSVTTAEVAAAPEVPIASQGDVPAADETMAAASAVAEPVAVVPTIQPTPGGKARVQLAAVKSEEAARSHWSKLQSAHSALLGQLELTVESVDKGADGIFYRIQAGPLADKATAKTLCVELKKQKQDCIVVR